MSVSPEPCGACNGDRYVWAVPAPMLRPELCAYQRKRCERCGGCGLADPEGDAIDPEFPAELPAHPAMVAREDEYGWTIGQVAGEMSGDVAADDVLAVLEGELRVGTRVRVHDHPYQAHNGRCGRVVELYVSTTGGRPYHNVALDGEGPVGRWFADNCLEILADE